MISKDTRYNVGGRFFIHAPAHKGIRSKKTGDFVSQRLARIQPPYGLAKPWECNLYYFWWEFMKRNPEVEYYFNQRNGRGLRGRLKTIWNDWGNIFDYETDEFWNWWRQKVSTGETRGEFLFAEPLVREMKLVKSSTKSKDTLIIQVPMEVRDKHLMRMFRKLLDENASQIDKVRSQSQARYKIHNPVRLPSLYHALKVLDAKKANPDAKLYELPDIAKIPQNILIEGLTIEQYVKEGVDVAPYKKELRRRKTALAKRYLSAATNYSNNAISGYFPHNPKEKPPTEGDLDS